MDENYYVVITTVSSKDNASRIANILLNKRLAACINMVENITSKYWWNSNIEESKEIMLFIKTREELLERVKHEILVNHEYEVAEVIALKIEDISLHYASWIDKETNKVL